MGLVKRTGSFVVAAAVLVILAACAPLRVVGPQPLLSEAEVLAPTLPAPVVVTGTLPPLPPSPSPIPPVDTPVPTATPDEYAPYTVAGLSSRSYGGGLLQVDSLMAETATFTRYLINYPSDGLTIYGFMNVPRGEGLFPVIIALHGYIDPAIYRTLDYTTGYADALANAGYLVIHPNLRGYRPSDDGPNLFRVGMATDVLNLIALVKEFGGMPGSLEKADPEMIGLWGHSMGGGISTRVITVSPDVRAAVLYGAMSGDERQNFEAIFEWSDGQRGLEELAFPGGQLERISPIFHYGRISAAVSVHHGEQDGQVPLQWSLDLCQRLADLEKQVECFTYPGQPHTFRGLGNDLFIQRTIQFFDRFLRGQ